MSTIIRCFCHRPTAVSSAYDDRRTMGVTTVGRAADGRRTMTSTEESNK